jgi:hypothetical protein
MKQVIDKKFFPIFSEISRERKKQDEKWGEQNHPMRGTGGDIFDCENIPFPKDSVLKGTLEMLRRRYGANKLGWFDILQEEVCEAFIETEPEKQREEMVQVAAVAVAIIEYMDRQMEAGK